MVSKALWANLASCLDAPWENFRCLKQTIFQKQSKNLRRLQ